MNIAVALPVGCYAVCHTICSFTCFHSESFCVLHTASFHSAVMKTTRFLLILCSPAGHSLRSQDLLAQTPAYASMPHKSFHCVSITPFGRFTGHPILWLSQDRRADNYRFNIAYITFIFINCLFK